MKRKELIKLGFGTKELADAALLAVAAAARAGLKKAALRRTVRDLVANPEAYAEDEHFGALAKKLTGSDRDHGVFVPRETPAPYKKWGWDIDPGALQQIENACSLPVAKLGALMPDAHVGYGLPIGGVLATKNSVIPYAVGVDIACRMKISVLDLPTKALEGQTDRLRKVLERETRFGIGAAFRGGRRQHDVLDEDWTVSPVTQRFKDKAWAQLGTSGSGNHFVEYGVLEVDEKSELGLDPGTYLALLSHSGSRGTGASVAGHYSKLAMELRPELPKQLRHLAWLDLDTESGQEYWNAMNLMGRYASANHAMIHHHVVKSLGARVLRSVENHHNFAWEEEHHGEKLIVHRKGATPAGDGDLGVIPGSMASPAFIVRGRGSAASLRSASHGAGRLMSRKKAKESFTWSETKKLLANRGVTLLSAGLDEVPMAYRDIEQVMSAQTDLVESLARFYPKMVKMAPPGERPED